ncbi:MULTISPECIES: cob(I)yrinic acid a,c-diamide adenosyltransferase [Agrobacterium]|uniref:Corrinoid adenosyltransferase n=1 Tax=Agrobacterium rosae TaxID=1972867 RepID=A0A1R3THB2_9HYPH|nr:MULTISPECIES: cob(I)yrinic acid a,c-diamide adenosyltransferase [Agrobacterium]KAA3515755.1 cob(I)yrinic acid a,c-diamide adenosyltransferase [Agrobacterium rosae]KAA3524715.1 cob(I)yrinic acid a,c-diamide adenosyltransferase [Agrobacterium rosae]MBN7803944.1 cob(I)yrinic acid a,c-diamide adenosyltransferase [Agrobacterium rosae]MCM2431664.1 cob(I)yrinic acid a,c-diamide adenosyltransferase [Agrobacterium rosae]MDX8302628.1 cob(I)yrinic acid a,c-diamide adenosyltransferase [Agrobacterium ro
MVKLNKIYTRTGDDGTTALVSGPRRVKHDLRIESFGTVDEANSAIGVARLHTTGLVDLDAMLFRIQNDLFDLGADLATPDLSEVLSYEPLRIVEAQVLRIENEIDALNGDLSPLKSFVLPGGTPAAAYLHLARTISRRAERQMVELSRIEGEVVSPAALKYINRLSDFLFVAARFANDAADSDAPDILWVPGQNR